jgi:glycosyltransferase involved in cell wall biosynthesis
MAHNPTMACILTCYYRPKAGGLFKRYTRAIQALLKAGHTVHYLSLERFPIDHPRCVFHRFPWPADKGDGALFWIVFHLLAPFQLTAIALQYGTRQAFCFDPVYALCLQPLRWMGWLVPTCFIRGDGLAALKARRCSRWMVRLALLMEGVALNRIRIVGVAAHLIERILDRHAGLRPVAVSNLPNDIALTVRTTPPLVRKPLHLAAVGPLTPLKNHVFLLELAKNAPAGSWELTIFGSGPEALTLRRRIADARLADRVYLAGWVPGDRIWAQVDLLLAPSLQEGMPNAVLEALANHVPVLASDIPGHRSILSGQWCLPLSDPDAWHRTLDALLENPGERLRSMCSHQSKSANRLRFDWDARVVALITNRNTA